MAEPMVAGTCVVPVHIAAGQEAEAVRAKGGLNLQGLVLVTSSSF